MWIRRVHEYYVKRKKLTLMKIPTQASWVVKKIFYARGIVQGLTQGHGGLHHP